MHNKPLAILTLSVLTFRSTYIPQHAYDIADVARGSRQMTLSVELKLT